MIITTPSLVLTFLGNDLETGHSTSQTISNQYIVNNSIKFKKTLMSGLKSASNQVALSLSKNCPSIEDIIATDGDIKAILKDGQTTLFTGYISTSFSWKVTKTGEQILQITLEDVSTRLLTKPFIETGYHLFNATVADAVDDICDAADITISSSAIAITDRVTYVAEAGQTCKELLEQMLYEVGYVYYCDNLGEMRFFKIDCTSTSDLPVLDKDNLYEQNGQAVTLTKKIRQYRSVRMTYTALATAGDYLIYRNTTGQDDNHPYCNMELQSGEHFDGLEIYTPQEWSEATADQFREPALVEACNAASETELVGSNKIIAIAELRSDVQKGANITVSMVGAGGPYIEINAQNNGLSAESITKMDLYANILYEKSKNIVRTGISGGSTDSLYTEDCEFIHSKALMTRHANLVCQYNAYCNSKYTFFSDSDIELGSLIHLSENVFSGLAVDVMVIGKTVSDDTPVVKYEAIGISVFSLDDDVYHRDTDTGKANTKGEKGAGSVWMEGTVLVGTTYARGVAANEGDYYLNTETFNIYRCVVSGGTNTALWQYTGNIKGKDYNVTGYTYEIEYGLSTSPDEFIYVDTTLGYDSSNAYGYQSDREYGFYNYGWGPTTEGWYHGLYVWTRIKITDADGNITYEDPTYAAELTQSLIDSCSISLSALPNAYTSNMRRPDSQYLFLSIRDVGYRGTLNIHTDTGVFASYNSTTGQWTDLTNALAVTLSGTSIVSDYGIKLPYAMENNVTIEGTFEEWTLDEFSVPNLSICPSIEKTVAVQLDTVNTYAELPIVVNKSSQDANIDDRLIKGDYILVKFLTLTATSTTQAIDETGKQWEISELSSYYDSNLDPITVSAFVVDDTYYAFAIYAWMYDGTQWTRNPSPAVEINTVKEAVDLAQIQHDIDPTVDYHRCLYAHQILVEKLTAGVINVGNIFVNDIESTNYTEDVDGTPTTGYKLIHNGGEDGAGEIKSVGGIFSNMNVRGSLKLWKDNDVDEVGANIEHPALTTISETIAGDPTGVQVVNSPVAWNSDSFLSQASSLTKNSFLSADANASFKNKTISYVLNVDNLNAQIKSAINQSSQASVSGSSWITISSVTTTTVTIPSYIKGSYSINFSGRVSGATWSSKYDGKNSSFWRGSASYSKNGSSVNVIISDSGSKSSPISPTPYPETDYSPSFNVSVMMTGGDSIQFTLGGVSFSNQNMEFSYYKVGTVTITMNAIKIGDEISSTGVWLNYSDGLKEKMTSGLTFADRLIMTSPMSFDSNNYKVLNNCANIINYWSFTDAQSVYHTLQSGITYSITSTGLYVLGNAVTGKYLTRNASSVVLIYEYNGARFSLEMVSGNYYQVYGTIKIAETSTKGVKVMGIYPKRDYSDPEGGFDCGNSEYRFENGYFGFVHGTPASGSLLKLKNVIGPYERKALDVLNSTEIVRFIRKDDKNKTPQIGFIADYTDKDLSGENQDSMLHVNCIGVLIKAVQELSAEITKLKGGN